MRSEFATRPRLQVLSQRTMDCWLELAGILMFPCEVGTGRNFLTHSFAVFGVIAAAVDSATIAQQTNVCWLKHGCSLVKCERDESFLRTDLRCSVSTQLP